MHDGDWIGSYRGRGVKKAIELRVKLLTQRSNWLRRTAQFLQQENAKQDNNGCYYDQDSCDKAFIHILHYTQLEAPCP